MSNIKYTKEKLNLLVNECNSIRQLLLKLGLKASGGNYKNIKSRLIQFEIDHSHFCKSIWNKNKRWIKKNTNIEVLLVKNCNYKSGLPYSSFKLKNLLLKTGKKEYLCECCKNTTWLDKPISLELHHINGINNDNRIENLQLLCPNCHSYTDNYRSKNKNASMT